MPLHTDQNDQFRTLITWDAGKDVEELGFSFIAGEDAKKYSHFKNKVRQFLTEVKILLLYDPAFALLGIYSKELKTCSHR